MGTHRFSGKREIWNRFPKFNKWWICEKKITYEFEKTFTNLGEVHEFDKKFVNMEEFMNL